MEIKNLVKNYIEKMEFFNAESLSQILSSDKPHYTFQYNDLIAIHDISNFILQIFSNMKYEKTTIELPSKFLFVGNKILINDNDLNISQNEFNNYLQSQVGYILSGKWLLLNKPSNVDKNISLIWLARFNFENIKVSYNNESLAKLCTRKSNLNIKYWAPTLNEKEIIYTNLILGNSLITIKDNENLNIIKTYIHREERIINDIEQYEITKESKLKLFSTPDINYNNYYVLTKDLKVKI